MGRALRSRRVVRGPSLVLARPQNPGDHRQESLHPRGHRPARSRDDAGIHGTGTVTMRVVVVGAGGHGQVVADVLLCAARSGSGVEPIGYVDDNASYEGRVLLGLPVLGTIGGL